MDLFWDLPLDLFEDPFGDLVVVEDQIFPGLVIRNCLGFDLRSHFVAFAVDRDPFLDLVEDLDRILVEVAHEDRTRH